MAGDRGLPLRLPGVGRPPAGGPVVVTAAALLSTIWLQCSAPVHGLVMPVPVTRAAGPVLAWAVAAGRPGRRSRPRRLGVARAEQVQDRQHLVRLRPGDVRSEEHTSE